jgi:hypothetical protein
MPTTPDAPVLRRTSQYVGAFLPPAGWDAGDLLDELIQAASDAGLTVQGSHRADGRASLVLRFPDDAAAVTEFHHLSADVHAPLVGIVTGLGVHRRAVTL